MRERSLCSNILTQHESKEVGRNFVAKEGVLPLEDTDDETLRSHTVGTALHEKTKL